MKTHRIQVIFYIVVLIFTDVTRQEDSSDATLVESNVEDAEVENVTNEITPVIESKQNVAKGNITISETEVSNATRKPPINCLMDRTYGTVEVVNATRLMKLLLLAVPNDRSKPKNDAESPPRFCMLVLFYARWCIFSSQAAPHFNALPRFFPHLKTVALDASKYQDFNMQLGIYGVPTLMIIYNGKPLVKFNESSYTLEMFSRFVTTHTTMEANGSLYVTSADFGGPVHCAPHEESDYLLVTSYIFIAICAIYFTFQSRWWRQFVELVQNTWRESNAQHEHVE